MATQLPTTPDVLMLAVQAQVIAFTGLPIECVAIDTREPGDDTLISQAEQYVVLRVDDGVIDPNSVINAGRLCTIERLAFESILWTRVALDEATRADILLTDPNLGHLQKRHQLYDALIDFGPTDANGNLLVSEVIKPNRSAMPKRPKGKAGWAFSQLFWVMPYQLKLTLTTPANY